MLRGQVGIHSIKVALLAERGTIEYDPTVWDIEKLIGVSLGQFMAAMCILFNTYSGNF